MSEAHVWWFFMLAKASFWGSDKLDLGLSLATREKFNYLFGVAHGLILNEQMFDVAFGQKQFSTQLTTAGGECKSDEIELLHDSRTPDGVAIHG